MRSLCLEALAAASAYVFARCLTFARSGGGSGMEEPNRFQKLVTQAKQHITEIPPDDARRQVEGGEAILIDVREESDWREATLSVRPISAAV
jgi:hypothetical protein